ncbi:MAG: c-type cytochrome, partial [Acetobacteraceae bacterium]
MAVLALWPLTGAAASPPDGVAIAIHGAAGLPPCASCHGAKGEGNAAIGASRLAGVGDAYLAGQLAAFASGARRNPIMSSIAKMLTPSQETAVAAYFSSLPPPLHASGPAGAGPSDFSNGAQ